jgi:subtilisin family serine protease
VVKASALAADPRVRIAQPNYMYWTSAQTSAASASGQLQYGPRLTHVDLVQPVASGKGVPVALIDTGVDGRHSRLAGRITEGGDFTGKGVGADIHGTMLAGIIASVAGGASIISYKACQPHSPQDVEARCWSASIARALDAAIVRGARVVNLSVGGPEDKLVTRLVETAVRRGIAVVAAAGNDGPQGRPSYPAAQAEVIAVTAVDDRKQLYSGATRGAYIDLASPGVDILSTAPGNRSLISSGTSFAAAHISGVAALLLERAPAHPDALQLLLERTAADLGAPGKDSLFGSGLVDACKAAGLPCR